MRECLAKGITSFHDAGAPPATLAFYRARAGRGEMPIRLYAMVRGPVSDAGELRAARVVGYGGDRLTVRAVKMYMDGALGSRGAWLLAPYSDRPGTSGENTTPIEDLERTARAAVEADFQVATHAIGDRAVRETLDIYGRALGTRSDGDALRWRVEHAQHVDPADIPRFAALGVVASVQGIHCVSDGPWVDERVGLSRARASAYPWRSLLAAGAVLVNGTDAPVEDVDPLVNFRAAVTRGMEDGGVFFPEQVMTREEALASSTRSAAWAAFEEERKGTLTPGKLADIVVLSHDILTMPDRDLAQARVDLTIVGGEIVYSRE
jgi:hypothetical protein